jgi:hypothetical protein
MKTPSVAAASAPRVFSISERLGRVASRLAGVLKPRPRPEPFREHDPRKAEPAQLTPSTPAHLLGAGGRAEFFRLPRL